MAFVSLLRKVVPTFASHGFSAHLNATYLLRIALDRLPNPIKLKWTERVVDNDWKNRDVAEPSDWMDRQSRSFKQLQDTFSLTSNKNSSQEINKSVQVPTTIGIWTKIVRIGHRIPQEVKVKIGSAKHQQWTATNSNTTKGSSYFFGSKQPLRIAILIRSRTNRRPDHQDHSIGKCTQFLNPNASRRNSDAKKNSFCFVCLSACNANKIYTSKVFCRHFNGKQNCFLHTEAQKATESTNLTEIDLPMCELLGRKRQKQWHFNTCLQSWFSMKNEKSTTGDTCHCLELIINYIIFMSFWNNDSTISYILNNGAKEVEALKLQNSIWMCHTHLKNPSCTQILSA